MCSRFLSISLLIVAVAVGASAQLRVCADPDNLPFSNRAEHGFENRIAYLLAREMHTSVEYTWQRMGRGFVREVLNKHHCDVLLGVPENFRGVATTIPYYRSTYVFVSRRDRRLQLASFDQPQLKHLKIGVQVLSEEYAPPAQALGRRGLVSNLVGFETTGGRTSSIIDAVAHKRIDAAVVWGPSAGYFAKKYPSQLQLTPTPSFDRPGVTLAFSISMGVRKDDTQLRDRLNRLVQTHAAAIRRILISYGVPLLPQSQHREVAGE
jgi:quinoprotein dehydrogenase-associated probable ABC transporter substrate-binding protein